MNAQVFPPSRPFFETERSESIGAIAAALAKAQGAMSNAAKDTLNPHFNRRYADLASVWDAARGPLSANGLAVVQLPEEGPTANSVALVTWLLHASGEWFRGRMVMPAQKADAQGFGSAITYARRYSLAAMIGVAPEEDDGGAAVRPQAKQAPPWQRADRDSKPGNVLPADALMHPPDIEREAQIRAFEADFVRQGAEGTMRGHAAVGARVAAFAPSVGERARLVRAAKDAAEAIRHRVTATAGAQAAFGAGSDPMVES